MSSSSTVQSGRKPRKGLSSLFKRKEQTPQTPPNTVSQSNQESPVSSIPESSDGHRTKARYLASIEALEEAVKGRENQWGSFDFPELRGELEDFHTSQLKDKINGVLEAQKHRVEDRKAWGKFRHAVECCFTTFTPFAMNFLTIAKDGSSVRLS
jgi:hypothetical protein